MWHRAGRIKTTREIPVGAQVDGYVADGWQTVADTLQASLDAGEDVGAGVAVYHRGAKVVDVRGGEFEPGGAPYDDRSLQLVFSTTKGITAIAVAMCVERGLLDYGAPVATYWPEFAAAGKADATVAQLISHQCGLISVDGLTLEEALDWDTVTAALAAKEPEWAIGTGHGYHALTYGWLAGELVRRVDGRRIGQYLAEEIAGPLGLDFWIGLPESEEPRVSRLEQSPPPSDPEVLALMLAVMGPESNGFKALTLNGAMMGFGADSPFNTRAVHATEMPAANGITTARSLARMYAATVGDVDGVRLIDDVTVKAATAERSNGPDACLVADSQFGCGFMLDGTMTPMLTPTSFGHAGAGGSLGYADPESKVGYGYVMNQMGGNLTGDPRTVGLTSAVRASL